VSALSPPVGRGWRPCHPGASTEPWGRLEIWIEYPDDIRIVPVEDPAGRPLRREPRSDLTAKVKNPAEASVLSAVGSACGNAAFGRSRRRGAQNDSSLRARFILLPAGVIRGAFASGGGRPRCFAALLVGAGL
jgi:hypothetical protein